MFYSLPEEELRTICRVNIEAFEKWARTVIHSELTAHLGANYFDIELSPNMECVYDTATDILTIGGVSCERTEYLEAEEEVSW